jgi:hypothetical protein
MIEQLDVVKFLLKGGYKRIEIHHRLMEHYGDRAMPGAKRTRAVGQRDQRRENSSRNNFKPGTDTDP